MSLGHARTLCSARGARWLLTPLAVIWGCLALVPAAAQAGQGNSTTPTFPVGATVGDTGLDASIEIANQSTPPQSAGASTICNFGDAGLCSGDDGITIVPSCGQINQGILACSGPDPGVFVVTSTPTGAVGSGCAGTLFDVTVADVALGKLRFTPQGGAHISLIPGATCKIDFKVSVQKLPTVDEDPVAPGIQTKQLATSRLVATLAPTSGQGTGTSFGTTVTPPPSAAPAAAATTTATTAPAVRTAAGSGGTGPGDVQRAGDDELCARTGHRADRGQVGLRDAELPRHGHRQADPPRRRSISTERRSRR